MKFLYPHFNVSTHVVNNTDSISIEYPSNISFYSKKDYALNAGDNPTKLALIRENVGYKNEWSQVKCINKESEGNDFFQKEFFILTKNITNVGTKFNYEISYNIASSTDPLAIEIDPSRQEIFKPYIDKKNGLFSVRIQIDYDKILDMVLMEKVLEEVYFEGSKVLLAARGLPAEDKDVYNFQKKYYTFSYVNNDLDLTVKKACEPLTFTVSIPLTFFEIKELVPRPAVFRPADFQIEFTNKNFINKIDVLISCISGRAGDVLRIQFPDKHFDSYQTDIEIQNIKDFAKSLNELLYATAFPIDPNSDTLIKYSLGFNKVVDVRSEGQQWFEPQNPFNQNKNAPDQFVNYILQMVNGKIIVVKNGNNVAEFTFNESLLSYFRSTAAFHNSRIINYFYNIENMARDLRTLDIEKYLNKYVDYPKTSLVSDVIDMGDNSNFSPDQVREFRTKIAGDSESCLKLSDVVGVASALGDLGETVGGAIGPFSTSMYDFFVQKDPNLKQPFENDIDKYKQSWQNLSQYGDRLSGAQAAIDSNKVEYKLDLLDLSPFSEQIAESVRGEAFDQMLTEDTRFTDGINISLNALGVFISKINWQEIFFSQIYCLIRGSGGTQETAKAAAELASDIPYEVVNYLKQAFSSSKLRGWRYLQFLANQFPWDPVLACNDEAVYLIKGLTKIIKSIDKGVKSFITLVQDLDELLETTTQRLQKRKNPYAAIKKAVLKIFYEFATKALFEFINDIFTAECEDPGFDNSADNFADPFSTHPPMERFAAQENNNQEKLNQNRKQALQETLPDIVRQITFGSDIEFTVNILDSYLKELRCMLSPIEAVQLLKGNPSEGTVVIAKNLIRKKYFKDPKNLSYFLQGQNLVQFFKNLGKSVDTSVLDQIEDAFTVAQLNTGLTYNELCSDQENKAVKDLLDSKIPEELDILRQKSENRIARAKKILDKIKNPEIQIKVLALCADNDDEDLNNLRDKLIDDYAKNIDETFSQTLDSFNEEATNAAKLFAEEKTLLRTDPNGSVFGNYNYNTYNSTLFLNLLDESNVFPNKKTIFKIKDKSPLNAKQIGNLLLKLQKQEINLEKCTGDEFAQDEKFANFLREERIVFEVRQDARDWGGIDKNSKDENIFAQAAKETISSGSKSNLYNYLRDNDKELFEFIKAKKTVLFISVEPNIGRIPPASEYKVWFRHIMYDMGVEDFRLLYQAEYEESKPEEDSREDANRKANLINDFILTLANYTGHSGTKDKLDFKLTELLKQTYKQYDALYYPSVKVLNPQNEDNTIWREDIKRNNNLYVLNENLLTLKDLPKVAVNAPGYIQTREKIQFPVGLVDPKITLNVIQSVFLDSAPGLQAVETYEIIINITKQYNVNGLFNIDSIYDANTKKILKVINVGTTDQTGKNIIYKPFASSSYDISLYENILFPQEYNILGMFNDIKLIDLIDKKFINNLMQRYAVDLDGRYFRSTSPEISNFKGWQTSSEVEEVNRYIQKLERQKKTEEARASNTQLKTSPEAVKLFSEIDFIYKKDDWFLKLLGVNATAGAPAERKFEKFYDNLKDQSLDIVRREGYVDKWMINYSLIGNLNYGNNSLYANCKLLPHYINLDYLKFNVMNEAKKTLCDNNLSQVPVEMLDDVLVNVTFRVYVTDLLIKALPFLATLEQNDLVELHNIQFVVDFIRELIKQEMHVFTTNYTFDSENDYYSAFVKQKVIPVYNKYASPEAVNKLKPNFISKFEDLNKEVNYFIRKEIKHCILFLLNNNIVTPRKISIFRQSEPFYNQILPVIQHEYYTLMFYTIMSSTIDSQKRTMFSGTKQEIARLFFSLSILTGSTDYSVPNDKDIIKFFEKMSFTKNPSLIATSNPDYLSYVKFAIQAIFEQVHQILQTEAMYSDVNILLTRLINDSLTLVGTFAWAFVEPEAKENIFNERALDDNWISYAFYKRLDESLPITGWAPAPYTVISGDFTVSMLIALFGGPIPLNPVSWVYLAMDVIKEAAWGVQAYQEMQDKRKYLLSQIKKDACTVNETDLIEDKCSPEKQKYLLDQINKFEEG